MGRKRNQGKARKAAKAKAKQEAEERDNQTATTSNGDGLEHPLATALSSSCLSLHGALRLTSEDICLQFAKKFTKVFYESCNDGRVVYAVVGHGGSVSDA